MYCASASAAHGIMVAAARRRGGPPRTALPAPGVHCHGQAPVNSASGRTSRALAAAAAVVIDETGAILEPERRCRKPENSQA